MCKTNIAIIREKRYVLHGFFAFKNSLFIFRRFPLLGNTEHIHKIVIKIISFLRSKKGKNLLTNRIQLYYNGIKWER